MALERLAVRYLVDTDLIISHLRKFSDLSVILKPLAKENATFLISSITVAEVFAGRGSRESKERAIIEQMLLAFDIREVTREIAQKGGEYALDYAVPLLDALIAATASVNAAIVITKNTKHFKKIQEIELYTFS